MVNTKNISAFDAKPPNEFVRDQVHYIEGGPLYELDDLASQIEHGVDVINLWTKKCIKDVQSMDMDNQGVLELLKVISSGKATYKNSQWCKGSERGPWAACDAYGIFREEWIEHAKKHMTIEYYVKYAIHKSGRLVLVVSCHLSN